ncbi:hypothetical protein Vadar_002361 [Vaccinium darrowii]|uniref:Uncharacterized protein n=1 Tax=Vaccinium darrowii TaxID=229202 RepID=A0ACB7XFB3_9ERIC|nr:hypothetical protein Vadar_002361 [Vaccinium darrowii]
MASSPRQKSTRDPVSLADAASWYCVIFLVGLILLGTIKGDSLTDDDQPIVRGNQLLNRPCDEIYVVGEGETLHTISDKCGDPFIIENNPHINDPDDVFPGLVIKITLSRSGQAGPNTRLSKMMITQSKPRKLSR